MESTGHTQNRIPFMLLFHFVFFMKKLRNSQGKRLGWTSFSRSSSSQLLATNFPGGFMPAPTWLLPLRCGKGRHWVFLGRNLLRAACCHFWNNSAGPRQGLELPSSSRGKEITKSKVTDKMSGPSRPRVMYCGLGEKSWHRRNDRWKSETRRSLAVSHPKSFKASSIPKHFSIRSLNCI